MANQLNTLDQQMQVNTPSVDIGGLSVQEVLNRMAKLEDVKNQVMKLGVHYGVIPGTQKPCLWKTGAETLACVFRLSPIIKSDVVLDDPSDQRTLMVPQWVRDPASGKDVKTHVEKLVTGYYEVIATCTIRAMDGTILAVASGTCNNAESKFNNQPYYDAKNAVLKRAEKRAMVSAILMATGGSGMFLEEEDDNPGQGQQGGSYGGSQPQGKPAWPSDAQRKLLFVKGKQAGVDVSAVEWMLHYFQAQFVKGGKAREEAQTAFKMLADEKPGAANLWSWAVEKSKPKTDLPKEEKLEPIQGEVLPAAPGNVNEEF